MSVPLRMELLDDCVLVDKDLRISFRRTVRVPDNAQRSYLPPDLGAFPLHPVSSYVDKLGYPIASKGGLFLTMYQSEAMWIDFDCGGSQTYMIKIYVGGVNVISAESSVEDAATLLRRRAKFARRCQEQANVDDEGGWLPLQDYVVVPGQEWLDGIAASDGTVRQFVATPFGSSYSVESQINGKDAAGGIQIEVTPYKMSRLPQLGSLHQPSVFNRQVFVKTLRGKTITIEADAEDTIAVIKERICQKEGVACATQRLIFQGKQLVDHKTLLDYGLQNGNTIHLSSKVLGGYKPLANKNREMGIAAGGKIRQNIFEDRRGKNWEPERTTVFNVQILDSAGYEAVTGAAPPNEPIDVQTYQDLGLPFYKMYEEPSSICGDFDNVKSVAQLKATSEVKVKPRTVAINPAFVNLANPAGPLRPFRTVADMKNELKKVHVASF